MTARFRRAVTDPATLAAWATYEAESKQASDLYKQMPIAHGHGSLSTLCACGRRTTSRYGTCRTCLLGRVS
jgi:hypothetical protein